MVCILCRRLSTMERKIEYLESKVEMSASNHDMTIGGDRIVIGAPIIANNIDVNNRNEDDEPSTFAQHDEDDESPTQDETSYTEDISESLAC